MSQDKVFVQDKVILRPKIMFNENTFQSGMMNTKDNIINKSTSNKHKLPFGNQRRVMTAGGNKSRSCLIMD